MNWKSTFDIINFMGKMKFDPLDWDSYWPKVEIIILSLKLNWKFVINIWLSWPQLDSLNSWRIKIYFINSLWKLRRMNSRKNFPKTSSKEERNWKKKWRKRIKLLRMMERGRESITLKKERPKYLSTKRVKSISLILTNSTTHTVSLNWSVSLRIKWRKKNLWIKNCQQQEECRLLERQERLCCSLTWLLTH